LWVGVGFVSGLVLAQAIARFGPWWH
jgi:hypothetical protein